MLLVKIKEFHGHFISHHVYISHHCIKFCLTFIAKMPTTAYPGLVCGSSVLSKEAQTQNENDYAATAAQSDHFGRRSARSFFHIILL